MEKRQKEEMLQWHPAFFAGLQIELAEDADNLIFENEHQLGTKPKEIDVLIIKKQSQKPVKKSIGRIFREIPKRADLLSPADPEVRGGFCILRYLLCQGRLSPHPDHTYKRTSRGRISLAEKSYK